MRLTKRRMIVAAILAIVAIVALPVWFLYAEPKLTLFAADRRIHNFAHMDEIFPSRRIAKSDTPYALPLAPRTIATTYTFAGETRDRDEFLKRTNTTGLLVVKDGTIVHEYYDHGYDRQTKATSFSLVKSFVSTLVGVAVDEGLIASVDDPISKYLPQLDNTGFAGASIAQVLQMSSGIDFSEEYDDPKSDAYTLFDQLFVFLRPLDQVILDYGSKSPPGAEFYYASINTQALVMLLRKLYGQDLTQIMAQKLWQPMGMTGDGFWSLDLHGTELGFMSLNATLRDYAKFGMMALKGGRFNGKRIVSERWLTAATTPDRDYLRRGRIYGDWGYQYQWWLPRGSDSDFAAIGIWGQMIYVDPKANLVVVKTGADENFHPHEFEAVTLFREIARQLAASG